jgi:hypothetical protein
MSVCGTGLGGDAVSHNQLFIAKLANKKFVYCDVDTTGSDPHVADCYYNSRGFRDQEWPQNLDRVTWCLGDSFTVGHGSCFAHTWPQALSRLSQHRVISVSMDGASNNWIARQACDVYDLARPKNIVIMWSYLHRREHTNSDLEDIDRRLHYIKSTVAQDYENFLVCRQLVHDHCTESNLIELVIPDFAGCLSQTTWNDIRDHTWPKQLPATLDEFAQLPDRIVHEMRMVRDLAVDHLLEHYNLRQQQPEILAGVILVEYLDRARDDHHFDIETAQWVAAQVTGLLHEQ